MKKFLLFVIIFIVIVAIPVTVYLVLQRQEIRKKAAPATTLAIVPANVTKKIRDEFTLEVQIDTGENQVIATELHVTFDSEMLQAVTITNGVLFPNVLTSGLVEPGGASITVGAPSNAQPVHGRGVVAVIRFKALQATETPTSIQFATTTRVSDIGEGSTSVLTGTTPAKVTINGTIAQDSAGAASQSAALALNQARSTASISAEASKSAEASQSAQASTSAVLKILTPTTESTTQVAQPTIRGTAAPGTKITLTIYSDPITVVVTADAKGNWTYVPEVPLDPGPHTIVATSQDGTKTTTQSFVVATASSEPPVSGAIEMTIFIMSLAFFLIGVGIAIPFVIH